METKVLFIENIVPNAINFFIVNNPRSDIYAAMELLHGAVMNQDALSEAQNSAYEILFPYMNNPGHLPTQEGETVPAAQTPGGWVKASLVEVADCKPDKVFLFTFLA